MSTEDRSAEEIRADIEQTREEVGDTVEALAAKSDVKAQAQQRIDEVRSRVRARAEEAKAKARSATPQSAQQGGEQVVAKIRSNPTPVIAGTALVAAFLIGRRTGRP
jgi:ElaB/YqjD/DUF883 family membrane-anchored ribosome-binding protein